MGVGAEQTAAALSQFADVETQTAAHTDGVLGAEVGVDIVRKVRDTVFAGDFHKGVDDFAVPVEILRDVDSGNGECEHSALGVAREHNVAERFVEDVHFLLEFAVGLVLDFAADDNGLVRKSAGNPDVESEVGEGALEPDSRRHVDVEHELLQALTDLVVGHIVIVDERCAVSVDGTPGLCARSLALRGERGVDQLTEEGTEVFCGTGLDLAHNAAETVGKQLTDIPARAVRPEESEVVQMNVTRFVGFSDLFGVNFVQPVFLGEVLADIVVESVDALLHIGVLLDAPVLVGKITREKFGSFADESGNLSGFLSSLAVKNVRLCRLSVTLVDEYLFDEVLNVLDGGNFIHEFDFRRLDYEVGKSRRHFPVLAAASLRRLEYGVGNFLLVEEFDSSVTLQNLDDH